MATPDVQAFPNFTPDARQLWAKVPEEIRPRLLANVFCGTCRGETTIVDFDGIDDGGRLVLRGQCIRCRSDVARVIE